MARANGIVFSMDPRSGPTLRTHLGARGSRALTPGGCRLELLADSPDQPRELHAIVSWDLAVPLKVERLALALIAAGGVLRRDLDADALRMRSMRAGHHVQRIASVRDLDAFRPAPATFALGAAPIGLPAYTSAA